MGIVNVTNLESGAVTGKSSGAESRQTALVGELGEGVGLIHELGQRRRAEELAYGGHNGTDIDKAYGGDGLGVLSLNAHFLANHALHTGDTDTELVLQQLAHRTDSAVAEMVDVVDAAHVIGQPENVADGGENVVEGDVLGDELILVCAKSGLKLLLVVISL